jgi:hypothetical protein
MVTGDMRGGAGAPGTGMGTLGLFAFSQVTTKFGTISNEMSDDNFLDSSDMKTGFIKAPAAAAPSITIKVGDGKKIPVMSYKPVVGFGPGSGGDPARPKPTAATTPPNTAKEVLESTTLVPGLSTANQFIGKAEYDLPTNAAPKGFIKATGTGVKGVTGSAAAAAFDPFSVSPGTFSSYQYTINANLQLDQVGDYAGITFFALDSRFTDPDLFYANSEPFNEALWSLTIASQVVPASPSDLDVKFSINPSARLLGILNPSMTDDQIGSLVQNAFTFPNGIATLTSFDLFPSGTIYTVSGTISYATGVNAGITAIPEPSSLTLLSIGAAGVMGYARRRRVINHEARADASGV